MNIIMIITGIALIIIAIYMSTKIKAKRTTVWLLIHEGETKPKDEKYKNALLYHDNKELYIRIGDRYIKLDNIIKVEKLGTNPFNQKIRLRNYSEYIIIAIPVFSKTKTRKKVRITDKTETTDLYEIFKQHKYEVRNPIYD